MTEFGKSPLLSLEELADLGYAAVLYPVTMLRVAMKAVEAALAVLADEGTQASLLDLMQTRQELYDLLEYSDYEERDRHYFGGETASRDSPQSDMQTSAFFKPAASSLEPPMTEDLYRPGLEGSSPAKRRSARSPADWRIAAIRSTNWPRRPVRRSGLFAAARRVAEGRRIGRVPPAAGRTMPRCRIS